MSGNVMLRFDDGNPTSRENLWARTRLCAEAQRAYDMGEDIIVPDGVTVVVSQPGFNPAVAQPGFSSYSTGLHA